jgi:hypothetical protein
METDRRNIVVRFINKFSDRQTRVAGLITVVANVMQNVSLVKWVEGGPYFVLFFASLVFVISFGILLSILYMNHRDLSRRMTLNGPRILLLVFVGLFDALNGYLVVYTSNDTRVMAILQTIIGNLAVVFTVVCQFSFVSERRTMDYNSYKFIAGLSLIILGVFITLLPNIVSGKAAIVTFSRWNVIYLAIFTVGTFFGALYNTLQEKALKARKEEATDPMGKESITPSDYKYNHSLFDCVFVLFFTTVFQLGFIISLGVLDMIPNFGSSATLGEVYENLWTILKCNLGHGLDGHGNQCRFVNGGLWGLIFIAGYTISYLSTIFINEKSSSAAMVYGTLTTPVFVVTQVVLAKFNLFPSDSSINLWAVFSAIVLFIVANSLWAMWEMEHRDSLKYKGSVQTKEEQRLLSSYQ